MSTVASLISPSRREALVRLAWRLDTPVGLAGMFGLALAVRLAIAPYIGFSIDLGYFRTWAGELSRVGTHGFYSVDRSADYPPGYLYVLWLTGKVSATPGYLLLKLPAILADLGIAWLAGTFAARLAPDSLNRRLPVRAVVAAAVLFNPAVIALSAIWGQVDAVPSFFVLASLLLLFTGNRSLGRDVSAFLLFGIAFAIKPQTAFALPVMLYALYRRYLHRQPRPALVDGALGVVVCCLAAVCVWVLSGLPFGLDPGPLLRFYRHSASVHPVTSANAFNLWGLLGSWRNDQTGDDVMTIAGIAALDVGMILFVVAVAYVLWRVHRSIERGVDERRTLVLGASVISLLGYLVLTRMHERYVFVALVLFAPLIFNRPLRRSYALLSLALFLDLWFAFAYYNSQVDAEALRLDPLYGWIFGGFAFDTWQKHLLSAGVVAVGVAVAWRGFDWLRREEPVAHPAGSPVVERPAAPSWRPPSLPAARALRGSLLASADDRAAGRLARRLPIALVGLSCLFGLIVLRGETAATENLNDSSFHLQMVRWASGQIHEGRVPLDGWFPYFSLGSSFFHHYQSLSELLTAYAASVTGAGDQTAYDWILYLLLALWPISVYLGARLLQWGRWTAAAAAAASPLLVSASGYGYEHGSYTWQGYGVYSQLWAMWLLPLAWGLSWRAIVHGRRYWAAALAIALTIACHFITGYLAVLTVGVWVIVVGTAGFVRRLGRAVLVVGGSLLVAAWVLVPLIADTTWTNQTEYYHGTIFNDSYGARKELGWLFTGELFDHGRFPIVTIFFFVGVLVCVVRARRDVRARALLGAFSLSMLLFFGRPTLGRTLDLLPGFGDVQIHRFVMGVHLAGILIAGVGLGWVLEAAYRLVSRFVTGGRAAGRYAVAVAAVAVALGVGLLEPAWAERAHYDSRDLTYIPSQQGYGATDGRDLDRLIAIVQARHDGRVYAGLRGNWGQQYRIGSVPVHAWLADRGVDAIGYVFRTIASLSTDVEVAFDETNPAQYQMLNIRYLILPEDRRPPVPARLLARSGRHRLWEVPTSGYFQVVDRSAAIKADRKTVEQASRSFRNSDLASRGIYPGVAFAGGAAPPPTFSGASPPPGPAGTVLRQTNRLQDGVFDATVVANRQAVVLLKASYDPRWTVTVDGLPDRPVMMAPSLVGVEVPAGRHVVRFRYAPYGNYPLLLAIGAVTLLGLALFPRRAAIAQRAGELHARARDLQRERSAIRGPRA